MSGAAPTAEIAKVASGLVEKWARIEPLAAAGVSRVPPPSLELSPEELDAAARWAKLFKEEMAAVRRVRNLVAHLGPAAVPLTDLVDANEFAERLLQMLVAQIPRLRDLLGIELPETPWWDIPVKSEGGR